MRRPELGCYVYCVVGERETPSLAGLTGVDPRFEVNILRHGELSAVASEVGLDEFGAEALKHNLEELGWLERTARAHDAVIARALGGRAVVPLRLCTIFADEARAREMLDRERPFLLDALQRLRGRAEWSVKLLADRQKLQTAASVRAPAGVSAGVESESPGRAFFARKRVEREMGEQVRSQSAAAAQETHDRLRQQAAAAILLPPQNRELSHRAGEMVLNGAYLVDDAGTEEFAAVVQELGRHHRELGLELELSGPFAPYNFVAREETGTAAGEESE